MPDAARSAWLRSIVPYARQARDCWPGMRVSCCLAQAAIESAWGKRAIGGWNLWGLKDLKWDPGSVDVPTHEYVDGQRVATSAAFEDFASPEQAFACYGRLVTNSPTYRAAREAPTLEAYVRALAAKWATDPQYAAKLLAIIADYELAPYDLDEPAEPTLTQMPDRVVREG